MESVEESILVNAPIEEVYRQWAHIEDFPRFMPAVRDMRRIDETHFHWRVERGGREYDSTFEIVLRIPERRIAWRTISGSESSGVVCFAAEMGKKTSVTFKMKYVEGAGWQSPSALKKRLKSRLKNFKVLMENAANRAASGGEPRTAFEPSAVHG
jgi:uncharacterized membrane protein